MKVPEWIQVDDIRGDVTENPSQKEGAVFLGGEEGTYEDESKDLGGTEEGTRRVGGREGEMNQFLPSHFSMQPLRWLLRPFISPLIPPPPTLFLQPVLTISHQATTKLISIDEYPHIETTRRRSRPPCPAGMTGPFLKFFLLIPFVYSV